MQARDALRKLIQELPSRLEKLPDDRAAYKPAADAWSAKEELGHLIDSAANNHQRIVRVQLEDGLAMPGYDGEQWVRVHRYQQRDWKELIGLWRAGNQQLLAAAETVPEAAWAHACRIKGGDPVTLRFVFDDYVHHMVHHLRHIGGAIDDLLSAMPSLQGAWQTWPEGRPPVQQDRTVEPRGQRPAS